jgi:lysophospholipase L1-like esterase
VRRTAALAAGLLVAAAALAPPRASAQTTTYIAFGDSITYGVGDDPARTELGYPPRLRDLLNAAGLDAEVINQGEPGEKTPEGLTRIGSVLDQGGDVLLLMEGSNDISREISPETTLFDLGEMARKAEQRGIKAVHTTVIPRTPRARVDAENLLNQKLNEQIRDLAGIHTRDLVDPFEAFGKIDDVFARDYLDDPTDFVGHPNADGYDIMARVFFDVLSGGDSTPPVEGLLVPGNGDTGVAASESVYVELWDFGTGIDLAATHLLVNGVDTGVVPQGTSKRVELSYTPPAPLANIVRVRVQSSDKQTPPNTVDREVARFVIAGTTFLTGDFNEDGRVDGADLVRFALGFGALHGGSRYRAELDFNHDGVIDGVDLAVLAANFGMSSF